jgi:hypothetical protein
VYVIVVDTGDVGIGNNDEREVSEGLNAVGKANR